MSSEQNVAEFFPYKTVMDEPWDALWAEDWHKIEEIFDTIANLEGLFNSLEVSILREFTQKKLILDLQKYAYSLSKVIREKFADPNVC